MLNQKIGQKNQINYLYQDLIAMNLNLGRFLNINKIMLFKKKVIGWVHGRSEFGPRALGNRSILACPNSIEIKNRINKKIKKRQMFRPFAPSVLKEDFKKYYKSKYDSTFMLMALKTNKKYLSNIKGTIHFDDTARVQTVTKKTNKRYYDLISKFKEKTGCPVIVNTSFNVRGEPIVNTPSEAFNCFMGTEMDYLVIGNSFLDKVKQNSYLAKNYKNNFELD